MPKIKNQNTIIDIQNMSKSFKVGDQDIHILKNISFKVSEGSFLIIFGPSGCGKSTLLHTILGLEPPTEGKMLYSGIDIYESGEEDDRSDFRKNHLGMVYQQSNWIKSMTVKENVTFPLLLLGREKEDADLLALKLLADVGMENWADYIPTELSSGQQQRVAIARSLINDPKIIVADEPTGNLDYESGKTIMAYLQKLNQDQQKTILMVTHDLEYLRFANSAVQMLDGKVIRFYTATEVASLSKKVKSKRGINLNDNSNTKEKHQ